MYLINKTYSKLIKLKIMVEYFKGLSERKKVSFICYSFSFVVSLILLVRVFDYNNSFTRIKKGQVWIFVSNEDNSFTVNDTLFINVIDVSNGYYKIIKTTSTSDYSTEEITNSNFFKKGNELFKN